MDMDQIQVVQEEEYSFPYHYVSGTRGGFRQCFNFWWGINYEATIDFLLQRLARESFASVVDVGCGDGRLVKEIADAFPLVRVCGVDFSQRAIDLAMAMNPLGDYRVGDITKADFPQPFDAATLIEVLEHIPPDFARDFIDGVERVLAPGGTLYLTVPHVNEPLTRKHYRHFTLETLLPLVDGFKVEEVVFLEVKSKIKKILTDF